jgi:hypothetical protein
LNLFNIVAADYKLVMLSAAASSLLQSNMPTRSWRADVTDRLMGLLFLPTPVGALACGSYSTSTRPT